MKTTTQSSVNPFRGGEDVRTRKKLLVRQPQEPSSLNTLRMEQKEIVASSLHPPCHPAITSRYRHLTPFGVSFAIVVSSNKNRHIFQNRTGICMHGGYLKHCR